MAIKPVHERDMALFVASLHTDLGIDPDRVSVEHLGEILQQALDRNSLALTPVARRRVPSWPWSRRDLFVGDVLPMS